MEPEASFSQVLSTDSERQSPGMLSHGWPPEPPWLSPKCWLRGDAKLDRWGSVDFLLQSGKECLPPQLGTARGPLPSPFSDTVLSVAPASMEGVCPEVEYVCMCARVYECVYVCVTRVCVSACMCV